MTAPPGPGTFVTINGASVDAGTVIDALVAQVGELSLALAAERARSAHLSAVLTMRAVEGAPEDDRPSQGHTEANAGIPQTAPDGDGGHVAVYTARRHT